MEQQHGGAGPEIPGHKEQHEALREQHPRIYVASLSDYNAGYLHGVWLDADQEPEGLQTAASEMLARSPTDPRAEEFAVHEYERFGIYRVGEYDSLDWISRIARGITEHGQAFGAWAEQCDHDQDRLEQFEDTYLGAWDSAEAYADELIDDLGLRRDLEEHVPDMLRNHVSIDVNGFARDLQLGGDLSVVSNPRGGVWIFYGDG
jgi:antirestriction protein